MPVYNVVRNRFAQWFRPRDKSSGEKLYLNGSLKVTAHEGSEVHASLPDGVRPSIRYSTVSSTHTLSCNCGEIQDGLGCPHLWALILWLDHRDPDSRRYPYSLSHSAWNRSNVSFSDWDWGEKDWDLDDEDEEDEEKMVVPQAESCDPESQNPVPAWRSVLVRQGNRNALNRLGVPVIELFYTLFFESDYREQFGVEIDYCRRFPDGSLSPRKPLNSRYSLERSELNRVDEKNRDLLEELSIGDPYTSYHKSNQIYLDPAVFYIVLPRLLASRRCLYRYSEKEEPLALRSDLHSPPWEPKLSLGEEDEAGNRPMEITLRREGETAAISDIQLLLGEEFVIFNGGRVSRIDYRGGLDWVLRFLGPGEVTVPRHQLDGFLSEYYSVSAVPLDLPDDISVSEERVEPIPLLRLLGPKGIEEFGHVPKKYQPAELFFVYQEREVPAAVGPLALFDPVGRRLFQRNRVREMERRGDLDACGIRWRHHHADAFHEVYFIPVKELLSHVSSLMDKGWRVEGELGRFHSPRAFSMQVSSGIDWFELRGRIDFDGQLVDLSTMIQALKKKERYIRLGDGGIGILPEEWWRKYGVWSQLGKVEKDHLRFERSQTLWLDLLLQEQSQENVSSDETFDALRRELRSPARLTPSDPDSSFQGSLREYQRYGLGWMLFLQRFRLGGCLADDMGLGKTVQVLALLTRCRRGETGRPSLVVVPRSLIFNWREEAARFTPRLKVIDASHSQRGSWSKPDADADVFLITYGTLLRDIVELKEIPFHYLVLDEAQAVKNHLAARAKAVRLLKADHRLALSGTPIENRIEELWSLFEFLNPGFLGSHTGFRKLLSADPTDESQREVLRKAVAPFILRRSKAQVAPDLPPRTEDVLMCEMESGQKKLYRELRDFYRQSLLQKAETGGMKRIQTQVLEALLRLRQAACHPLLVDSMAKESESVKIDTLLEQLEEVLGEGHKALIFSQFTAFLALLKPRLDQRKWSYEYLDGKTRNRQERVERFENDPDCPLFLISLKAGGLGLNLVSADYVFLLDPWWNPAIEAQAIDRTHRIGQDRPVFAYRLICRDTVEEKILQLQKSKKSLADSIITESPAMLREMSAEDLAFLLS